MSLIIDGHAHVKHGDAAATEVPAERTVSVWLFVAVLTILGLGHDEDGGLVRVAAVILVPCGSSSGTREQEVLIPCVSTTST